MRTWAMVLALAAAALPAAGHAAGKETGGTPAAERAVKPLPRPAHPKELDPAPGKLTPAGPVPAQPEAPPMALVGATVHTVSGRDLPGATVLVEGGKVRAVGSDVAVPAGYARVDVSGLHLYPSLINAGTVLGLTEIGAVRATNDIAEVGEVTPEARAEAAVNPASELIPVTRSNGVLVALTEPQGGLVSGSGAVLELDGWTWEDMTLKAPASLHVNWPGMRLDRSFGAKPPVEQQERARDQRIERIREAFEAGRAYMKARELAEHGGPARDRDVRWEALGPALRREVPVVIQCGSILEIEAALAFAEKEQVRLVIEGGSDTWRVADKLKQRGVAVLCGNVMDIGRAWEPYDVNFTTPLKLSQAGVEYAIIQGSAGGEASNARNLPYVAAKAAAYGLPPDEALKAITLYPARILGVGDRLGSIEPGKDATLILTDGNPLEQPSNVQRAWIRGRELDLTDRHKRLYERYRQRPRPPAR